MPPVQGERESREIFDLAFRVFSEAPVLQWSDTSLSYEYRHPVGATECAPIVQFVTISNVSGLPLAFGLKAPMPFVLSAVEASLGPGESTSLSVTLHPGYKGNLVSHSVRERLSLVFRDNSNKDGIDLSADLHFPNLAFEAVALEFGIVLNNTTKRLPVAVSNPGTLPVDYTWAWGHKELISNDPDVAKGTRVDQARELFDILPIYGRIEPGERQVMEFTYFAYPGLRENAVAVCKVAGGPEYQIRLAAESNMIYYHVEPTALDFGFSPYDRAVEKEVRVFNRGRVPFDFYVNVQGASRPGVLEALPPKGRVAAGESTRIRLMVRPGTPDVLSETAFIEIAHFEPIPINIKITGTYPTLALNLPRLGDALFEACIVEARTAAALAAMGGPTDELTPQPTSTSIISLPPRDERKIETEAERLRFRTMLLAREKEITAASRYQDRRATFRRQNSRATLGSRSGVPSARSSVNAEASAEKERSAMFHPDAVPVRTARDELKLDMAVAHYLLDFGPIVKGASKAKKLRFSNVGHDTVAFTLDVRALENAGVTLSPEANQIKLTAPPDRLSVVDVTFTLSTSGQSVPLGPFELTLPFMIRGGPPAQLTLRYNTIYPEMSISADDLDFGTVLTGRCKARRAAAVAASACPPAAPPPAHRLASSQLLHAPPCPPRRR